MNDDPVDTLDPFQPSAPDEQTELDALVFALQAAQGYALIFARCNDAQQRRRLSAAIEERVPELATHSEEIVLDAPVHSLLDELRIRLEGKSPKAVFVSGLERSMPIAADAPRTPFAANLNASRNSFPQVVHCPLVLWVSDYILTAILYGAPDFFSVRSGVYYFVGAPKYILETMRSLVGTEEWALANLPLQDKLERIRTIEGLLADYRTLPSTQQDEATAIRLSHNLASRLMQVNQWRAAESILTEMLNEARQKCDRPSEAAVLSDLGYLFMQQSRWQEAIDCYEQSLVIYQQLGNQVVEGRALVNLGLAYQSQGRWQEAIDCYEQSLILFRELGDWAGEGRSLNNLGLVYRMQGRWQEAINYYEQSLVIKRKHSDRVSEGVTLNNLGAVYQAQGKQQEAIDCYEQSLLIYQKYGYRMGEGQTLNNLSRIYVNQGRYSEAERLLQQVLEIRLALGDRSEEGGVLQNLAVLSSDQGHLQEGIEFQKRAVSVFDEIQDERVQQARELLAEMEKAQEDALKSSGDRVASPSAN